MFRGALIIAGLAVVGHLVVLLVSSQTVGVPTPQSSLAQHPALGDPERGTRLIKDYGCGACHSIPGIREARGKVGPPLGDFAERAYIAGQLPNTPENIIRWIQNPQALEPETAMPNLNVSSADARDIAAYLQGLGGR